MCAMRTYIHTYIHTYMYVTSNEKVCLQLIMWSDKNTKVRGGYTIKACTWICDRDHNRIKQSRQ